MDDNIVAKTVAELTFFEILLAIVVGWVLVELWTKVIENLAYRTVGLNKHSTWHTFIVASVATLILLAYIVAVGPGSSSVIEEEIICG